MVVPADLTDGMRFCDKPFFHFTKAGYSVLADSIRETFIIHFRGTRDRIWNGKGSAEKCVRDPKCTGFADHMPVRRAADTCVAV